MRIKVSVIAFFVVSSLAASIFAAPILTVSAPAGPFQVGDNIPVTVTVSDDGAPLSPTLFDSIVFQLMFNDNGNILSAGTNTAGALAGNSILTADLFAGPPPAGAVLVTGPAAPDPGFASTTGAFGLLDFTLFSTIPASTVVTVNFTALAAGTSNIQLGGAPGGSFPIFAVGGQPIQATLENTSITVESQTATPVPEPSSLLVWAMLGTSIAGVSVLRRRRRKEAELSSV